MADVKISGLPASTVPLAGTEVLPIVQGGATKQVSIANVTAGRAIAATSITTDTYKAASSSGGALQNSGGTPQLQWGAGGGNNLSVDVAININPANAAVAISPTGTGTVTVNPATAGTINNMSIGATTALTGRFTSVTATTGNLVIGTSGKGIDFSVTPDGSGTMTSELLADYEEGTWTPVDTSGANLTFTVTGAAYRKIGSIVFVNLAITYPVTADANFARIGGLPFTSTNTGNVSYLTGRCGYTAGGRVVGQVQQNQTRFNLFDDAENLISNANMSEKIVFFSGCYIAA